MILSIFILFYFLIYRLIHAVVYLYRFKPCSKHVTCITTWKHLSVSFVGLLYGKIYAKPHCFRFEPRKTIMWQIQYHGHPIWGEFNSYLLSLLTIYWYGLGLGEVYCPLPHQLGSIPHRKNWRLTKLKRTLRNGTSKVHGCHETRPFERMYSTCGGQIGSGPMW